MNLNLFACKECGEIQTQTVLCIVCGSERVNPYSGETPVHKFHAQVTFLDGIRFQSKREANRWGELQLMAKAGSITNLQRQVPYELHAPGGGRVTKYVADFQYTEGELLVVEDAKGVRTETYRIKRKWLLLEYGIKIREV